MMRKRNTVVILFLLVSGVSYGQWNGNSNKQHFNGRVGIGTTNPTERLDVNGNIRVRKDLQVRGQAMVNRFLIERDQQDSYLTFHDPNNDWYTMGIDVSDGRKFKLGNGGSIGPNHFVMLPDGKVGVGTSNPTEKLDVNGSIRIREDLQVRGQAMVNRFLIERDQQDSYLTFHDPGDVHYSMGVDVSDGGKFKLGYGGSIINNHFVMLPDGKTGIGTPRPTRKLDVNGSARVRKDLHVKGKIVAGELLCQAGGSADFVFEDDYRLRTLAEVEAYIVANKHLPEIAPAAEMEANGLQINAFVVQLLQKVEELTLYTIAQEKALKKIDELEDKLARMEELVREQK